MIARSAHAGSVVIFALILSALSFNCAFICYLLVLSDCVIVLLDSIIQHNHKEINPAAQPIPAIDPLTNKNVDEVVFEVKSLYTGTSRGHKSAKMFVVCDHTVVVVVTRRFVPQLRVFYNQGRKD